MGLFKQKRRVETVEEQNIIEDSRKIREHAEKIRAKVESARKEIKSPFITEKPVMTLKDAVRKAWAQWVLHNIDTSKREYIDPFNNELRKKLSDDAVKIIERLRKGEIDAMEIERFKHELVPYLLHHSHEGVRELIMLYALQDTKDANRSLYDAVLTLFSDRVISGIAAHVIRELREDPRFRELDKNARAHLDPYFPDSIHIVGDPEEIERLIQEAVQESVKNVEKHVRLPPDLRDPRKMLRYISHYREEYANKWMQFMSKGMTDIEAFLRDIYQDKSEGEHNYPKEITNYIVTYGNPSRLHDLEMTKHLAKELARRLRDKIPIHRERVSAYERLSEIYHAAEEIAKYVDKYNESLMEIEKILREHGEKKTDYPLSF